MRRLFLLGLSCGLASMVLASSAAAQKPDRPKGRDGGGVQVAVSVGFSTVERRIVTEYYAEHRYEAKPLPPGIAKNLARGKPLPPGIAKRQLPADLRARLQSRVGAEITIFGDRIVLLEASGLVVDILEGVFG
jgi:hypothetical protein